MGKKAQDVTDVSELFQSKKITGLSPGQTVKGKLTEKDPHITADFTQGERLPFGFFKLSDIQGPFSVEIISLGNMIGFKKTMMFPLIMAFDAEGKEVFGESTAYENRDPDNKYPMHVFASWTFDPGDAAEYLLIYPDMVSAEDTKLKTGSNKGIVTNAILRAIKVKKDAYARYHITLR